MQKTLLIFLTVLIFTAFDHREKHDFHLSKCDIVYDQKIESLQITLHIFIDDLELALKKASGENLFLCTEKEPVHANRLIQEYLSEKLRIKVDGEDVALTFLGKEVSDDLFAIWCYLEKMDVRPVNQIEVKYDVLMEVFQDQRNIVKLELDRKNRMHFLFDQKSKSGKMILK